MSSASLFAEIALSYRKLISAGREVGTRQSLRAYCRKRHVSYADFLRWALMSKAAAGLPGLFGEDISSTQSTSGVSSRHSATSDKASPASLLYPVDLISPVDMADTSLENPAGLLSGVHIRFADGTTVFIQQGSAQQISDVINSCKS